MPCKLFFELPKAYFLLYKVGKGLLQEFLLSLSLSLSHTHTHTHTVHYFQRYQLLNIFFFLLNILNLLNLGYQNVKVNIVFERVLYTLFI